MYLTLDFGADSQRLKQAASSDLLALVNRRVTEQVGGALVLTDRAVCLR